MVGDFIRDEGSPTKVAGRTFCSVGELPAGIGDVCEE